MTERTMDEAIKVFCQAMEQARKTNIIQCGSEAKMLLSFLSGAYSALTCAGDNSDKLEAVNNAVRIIEAETDKRLADVWKDQVH